MKLTGYMISAAIGMFIGYSLGSNEPVPGPPDSATVAEISQEPERPQVEPIPQQDRVPVQPPELPVPVSQAIALKTDHTKNQPRSFESLPAKSKVSSAAPPSFSGSQPVTTGARMMTVSVNGLNVRAAPGRSNRRIGRLEKGDLVQVTGRAGNWTQVRNPNASGWVYSKYLRGTETQERQKPIAAADRGASAPAYPASQIKRILIRESINSYSGKCPCPDSRMSSGRRCGKRSAYSRPGGASPLCYEEDVTQAMIDDFLARNPGF